MIRSLAALLVVVALISLAPAAPVPKHLMPKGPQFNFPTGVGTKWVYVIEGGGEHTRVITRVEEKNGAKFVTSDWIASTTNRRTQTIEAITADGVYIHKENGETRDPPLLSLKLPPSAGEVWCYTFSMNGFEIRTQKTAGPVEKVKVPAGEFDAVRVDVEMHLKGKELKTTDWYANGIGMVKSSGGFVLKSFTPGKD